MNLNRPEHPQRLAMHTVPCRLLEQRLEILCHLSSLSADLGAPLVLQMLSGLLDVSVPRPSGSPGALVRETAKKISPDSPPCEGPQQQAAAPLQGEDLGQREEGGELVVDDFQREDQQRTSHLDLGAERP